MEPSNGLGGYFGVYLAKTVGHLGPARAQHHGSIKATAHALNQLNSGSLSPFEWVHAPMVEGAGDTSRTAVEGG